MKKISSILTCALAAACSLYSAGCVFASQDADTSSGGVYDAEVSGYNKTPFAALFENDLGVYGMNTSCEMMMYLDEDDMAWYPLCNRPDCDHTIDHRVESSEKSECNAYVDFTVDCGMVQWNDRIYYPGFMESEPGVILYSMATDGTDHKTELEYTVDSGADYYAYLNRGKMYVTLSYNGEKNYSMVSCDFDNPKEEPVTVWEGERSVDIIGFTHDYIVYVMCNEDYTEADVYRMNQDGSASELLFEGLTIGGNFRVNEEGLFTTEDGNIVYRDFETREETVIWDSAEQYDCNFTFYVDESYIYMIAVDDRWSQGNNDLFLILDTQGNVLEEMTIPNMEQLMSDFKTENDLSDDDVSYAVNMAKYGGIEMPFVGSTSKYVFASDGFFAGYYIEKADIGSGNCEWKEAEIVR